MKSKPLWDTQDCITICNSQAPHHSAGSSLSFSAPINLPVNAHGKEAENGLSTETPATHVGDQDAVPSSRMLPLLNPCCNHLLNEFMNGKMYLSPSPSFQKKIWDREIEWECALKGGGWSWRMQMWRHQRSWHQWGDSTKEGSSADGMGGTEQDRCPY